MYVFAIASIFYRCIIIIVGCYRSFYFFFISNSTRIIKEREKALRKLIYSSLSLLCVLKGGELYRETNISYFSS